MILAAAAGGMEIAVFFSLLVGLAIVLTPPTLVYRGVRQRNSTHPYAWAAMALIATVPYGIGLLPFAVFYWVVRDEIGPCENDE